MYDPARNKDIVARFKAGEPVNRIARDHQISSTRVTQIVRAARHKDKWYEDKLPTMMRNSLSNLIHYERHVGRIWEDWTEQQVAEMVASFTEAELFRQPNIGITSVLRIQDWLDTLGLELKKEGQYDE